MSDINPEIDTDELLGRAIFDSKKAKSAAKGTIPPKVFRERDGVRELSVDRLSIGDVGALIKTHDEERVGQSLQGWAVVTRSAACEMNRTVVGVVTPTNPWHAEIVLNFAGDADPDEQTQHAVNLANNAEWKAR
ncbi:hypothetical protein [Methylobacterium sp. A52T]